MIEPQLGLADWYTPADQAALRLIRTRVFIEEQQVPEALEWDDHDAEATHFLVYVHQQAIGCARLLADGHVGRVALLPHWRRQGIGHRLLCFILATARQRGLPHLMLAAQTHATCFYQALGFEVCSSPYLDAGILHVDMELSLSAPRR